MKRHVLAAATLAAALLAGAAQAATVTVDGVLDSAYGAPTAHITYNAAAPSSNFSSPTMQTAYAGYSIYLTSDANYVYGFVQQDGTGTSAGAFTNLYFDLDPSNNNGSDLGFEVTNNDAFIPGGSGPVVLTGANAINYVVASGGTAIEFAIPTIDFTQQIAGLTYDSYTQMPTVGTSINLRLSQTFGYSVAGYTLGSVTLGGVVPEPASWLLMIMGLGLTGGMLRLKRRAIVAA